MTRGGNRVSSGDDSFPKDGLPSRPLDLTEEEQKTWTLFMSHVPNKLLRRIDVWHLRSICELLTMKNRTAEACKKDPSDQRSARLYLNQCQMLARYGSMFGMSPVDRRRIDLEPELKDEEIGEWD